MPRLNSRWENFWKRGQAWYRFWEDTASSSETSVSTTDAAAETDAATRTLGLPRSATDAATEADAVAQNISAVRSTAETAVEVDTATLSSSLVRSAAEAAAEADTAARNLGAARSTVDSGTTADSAVASTGTNLLRTTSEAATQADVATRLRSLVRSASEAVSAADAAVRSIFHSLFRTTSDEASATDAFSPPLVGTVPVPDHIIEDTPVYHGAAMAVHVETDPNPTVVPTAAGIETAPAMLGQAPAITTNVNSPDQFHLETLTGPIFDVPVYRGVSDAIHVWGNDDTTRTPPEPINGCDCTTGCSSAICGITDTFSRSGALGTSDMGLPWSGYLADFSTNGTAGVCALVTGGNNSGFAFLNTVPGDTIFGWSDGTVTAQVTVDAQAPDSNRYFALFGDSQDGNEGTWVDFTTDRLFEVSTYATYDSVTVSGVDPTLPFKIRSKIDGGNLYAKIWQASDSEPTAWMLSVAITQELMTDIGVAVGAGFPFTNNFTVVFDDLNATGFTKCEAVQFDDFNRTVASGWGTATPSGLLWHIALSGTRSVGGGYGKLASTTSIQGYTYANFAQTDFTMYTRFTTVSIGSGSGFRYFRLGLQGAGGTGDFLCGVNVLFNNDFSFNPTTGGYLGFSPYTGSSVSTPFTWTAGTSYDMEWTRTGQYNEIRVWITGTARPSTPTLSVGPDGNSTVPASFVVFQQTGSTAEEYWFDWFDFDYASKPCYLGGPAQDGSPPCTECDDPLNPGFQIPAFTPGFMPTFRRQIGDPTTNLDSWICTFESAAMVLDWHTRGAVSVWGGELIPYSGRTEASIIGAGGNLGDMQQAWMHWVQYLEIRSGQNWNDLYQALLEGRAVILQGDYGELTLAERCQDSFDGGHAVSLYPYQVSDRLLVGDPLCSTFKGLKISTLQAYAEAFGAAVYGVTSPQKILFAVSRPWVP